jgi:hypothetical protein
MVDACFLRSSVKFCSTECFTHRVISSNRLLWPSLKILSLSTFFSSDWDKALMSYHSDKFPFDSTFHFLWILHVIDILRDVQTSQRRPEVRFSYFIVQFEFHRNEILMSCQFAYLNSTARRMVERWTTTFTFRLFLDILYDHMRPENPFIQLFPH